MHTLNIRIPCDAESGCRSDGMDGPRLWVCEGVSEEGVFRIQEFNKLKHSLRKIKHSFNVSTLQLDLFLVLNMLLVIIIFHVFKVSNRF